MYNFIFLFFLQAEPIVFTLRTLSITPLARTIGRQMGLPHQLIAALASTDILITVAASLNLGLLPFPNAPSLLQDALIRVGAKPVSSWDRLFRVQDTLSHTLKHAATTPPPRKLIFVILAVCLARCSAILSIWASVAKTVSAARNGAPGEDFSGRAIAYSAVCVISMLFNLSMLNLLFQTHTFGSARPDTSVQGILKQLNTSSLAAEQLIVSAAEWILFVLFIGTNKWLMARASRSNRQAISAGPAQAQDESEEEPVVETAEQAADPQQQTYGALGHSRQLSSRSVASARNAAGTQPEATDNVSPMADTSLDSSTQNALHSESQTLAGDATPTDIVDVPTDRQQSKQDAKDRLQRARENGKVRRRSLWKKIRSKTNLRGSSNANANAEESNI